ncbi:MAG: hypothetical protein HYR85_07170 [Planctomycetes bacterium]|nr:hypothetical protein [Planctomycetota bacterium]MBI3848535.1 hypothetical protein [Planctomycetota bacterium]
MATTNDEHAPDSNRSEREVPSPLPGGSSPIRKPVSRDPVGNARSTPKRRQEDENELPPGIVVPADDAGSASYLDLLEEADTLFLSHEYERALEFADRAHAQNPSDQRGIELRNRIRSTKEELRSCLDRAKALVDEGRPGHAIPLLTRARVLQPHNESIRARIDDAQHRHVADRRAVSRALAREKNFTRAASAAAEAASTSGEPRDHRRVERCRRAATRRARLLVARCACVTLSIPIFLVGILQSRNAILLVGAASPIRAGNVAAGRDSLTTTLSTSAIDTTLCRRLLVTLSAASIRVAIADGCLDDAVQLAQAPECDPDESFAASRLCDASKLILQNRLEEASREISSLPGNSSEVVKVAGMKLRHSIRERILATALSLEKAGRFAEELSEIDRLAATGTTVKAGEEDVRRELATSIAECLRLESSAGEKLEKWLELDSRRRSVLSRAASAAPVLRERGGEGFLATLATLETTVYERIPEAAKRRALAIRAQLERSAPNIEEDDSTALSFLATVRDIRAHLGSERYRTLATSLVTILR